MTELLKLLLPVLIVIVVVAILLPLLKSGGKASAINYKRIDRLFSKAERSFYGVLAQAVGSQFNIMGKVRLSDVIRPGGNNGRSGWQSAFNRITSKHLDFVACDPSDFSIRFAVELDDSSHHRGDRTARDKFLNEAMKSAGVPLFRFSAKRAYSIADIRSELGIDISERVPEFPCQERPASGSPDPELDEAKEPKHVSTSALSRNHGMNSKQLFERLQKAGLIIRKDDAWALTELGESSGGTYKTHARYGKYIAWPETLPLP